MTTNIKRLNYQKLMGQIGCGTHQEALFTYLRYSIMLNKQ